jgi:hypothetical protein
MRMAPAHVDTRPILERIYAPEWAGGWVVARYLWVFAALLEHGWRMTAIKDAYAASDMVFASGMFRVAEYLTITTTMGYLLWALSIIGLFFVAYGGRLFRPGLLLWFVAAWLLMGNEALNVKAHDRLLTWVAIGLFISPAGERGLENKYRSPIGRYFLLIAFCAIYGSTGLAKHLHEPSWWVDGEVLAYHLLNYHHGGNMLAVWFSGQSWLVWIMAVVTVLFEVSFPFLIWFRRLNPWVLLIGALFHCGTLFLMDVGPFAFVSLSAYPVLLHPEFMRESWDKLRSRYARRSISPAE